MAIKEAVKEQLFIKSLISQLGYLFKGDINNKLIYTDSQSAIDLANNPINHNRTKHIDIQYHFIRENILVGNTELRYIPIEELVADGLTKALPNPKYLDFITRLGLVEL